MGVSRTVITVEQYSSSLLSSSELKNRAQILLWFMRHFLPAWVTAKLIPAGIGKFKKALLYQIKDKPCPVEETHNSHCNG